MQVVASNPLGLDENSIDSEILVKEKEVYKAELDKLNKKDDIKRNIMEGKIKKFISENTLLNQPFIKDNEIIYFKRYQLGEGIDKKKEDFAEEVYNQIK
jgi:elongation factor Ts